MREFIASALRTLAQKIYPAPKRRILGEVVSFSHSVYAEPEYTVRVKMDSGDYFEGQVFPVVPTWTKAPAPVELPKTVATVRTAP